jgi:hypothetical protein
MFHACITRLHYDALALLDVAWPAAQREAKQVQSGALPIAPIDLYRPASPSDSMHSGDGLTVLGQDSTQDVRGCLKRDATIQPDLPHPVIPLDGDGEEEKGGESASEQVHGSAYQDPRQALCSKPGAVCAGPPDALSLSGNRNDKALACTSTSTAVAEPAQSEAVRACAKTAQRRAAALVACTSGGGGGGGGVGPRRQTRMMRHVAAGGEQQRGEGRRSAFFGRWRQGLHRDRRQGGSAATTGGCGVLADHTGNRQPFGAPPPARVATATAIASAATIVATSTKPEIATSAVPSLPSPALSRNRDSSNGLGGDERQSPPQPQFLTPSQIQHLYALYTLPVIANYQAAVTSADAILTFLHLRSIFDQSTEGEGNGDGDGEGSCLLVDEATRILHTLPQQQWGQALLGYIAQCHGQLATRWSGLLVACRSRMAVVVRKLRQGYRDEQEKGYWKQQMMICTRR